MASYAEILETQLTNEWIQEPKILSSAVCEKYNISRAGSKRTNSAKSALKQLHASGGATKGLTTEGKVYWRSGSGDENSIMIISDEESYVSYSTSFLVSRARKNIETLENFLVEFTIEKLTLEYSDSWESKIPERTFEKLDQQRRRNEYNKWINVPQNHIFCNANITDFADIYRQEWQLFKPTFGDKEITLGKLKEIGYLRNAIQHNSELESREYIFFNTTVERFLDSFQNKNTPN
jgi:hypothetical protein